jgi:hypothetical protein
MLNIAATLSLLIQIAALKPSRLSRYKRSGSRWDSRTVRAFPTE